MVAEEIVKEEKGLAARFPLMRRNCASEKVKGDAFAHHP
jgi:hypothetical protein